MNQVGKLMSNVDEMIKRGRLSEAKAIIESYAIINGKDINYYTVVSVILVLEGLYYDAENLINECLTKNMFSFDLLSNLRYVLKNVSNKEKADEVRVLQKLLGYDLDYKVDAPYKNNNFNNIVMGTIEIANQMNTHSVALRGKGFKTTTINYYDSYLKYNSDYTISLNSFSNPIEADFYVKKNITSFMLTNDVFHFHFGTSLALDNSDLPLLKEMGKKMIMQYWGSDVRIGSVASKYNPYSKSKAINEDEIKRKLAAISTHINDCFVDFELAEYVKDYHNNIHITRSSIDLNKFKNDYFIDYKDRKTLIVHAPTSPEYKGTEFIVNAVESLYNRGDFEFQLITGMKNEEAIEIYKKADIIIDQLHTGTYGLFAVEAMALGKPVVCWISDFMKEKLPAELPIIVANPDTIKTVLKELLDNKDELKNIGKKSREYVEKYHDVEKNILEHLEVYKSL